MNNRKWSKRELEEHKKKALEFSGKEAAYIHAEIKEGITQLVVSGDTIAIIYGCYRTLERTKQLTGIPFEDMIDILHDFLFADPRTSQEEV